MAVRLFQAGEWGEKWGRGGGNGVYTRSIRLLTVITVEQSRESFPWEMATLFVILSKVRLILIYCCVIFLERIVR